jgi:polyhydroxybutyrate depolymerase
MGAFRPPRPWAGVLLALALLCGCALTTRSPAGLLPPGDHTITLAHAGRTRSYLLHLPPQAARDTALPVVVVFHGAAADAARNRAWLGLNPFADREGFIAVYPDGTGPLPRSIHMWNAGACCGSAQWGNVDDVGFVLAMLDDVATRTPIDATRVYATGFSNGGMLTYRLAAEASDRFAAIAPVAGTSAMPLGPRVRPMPVMHVHSVDDTVVPYGGGTTPIVPFLVTIRHPVVEEVVRAWARHDGCPDQPVANVPVVRPRGERDAEHTATRLVWQPCAAGTEVVLWRLTGPGHVWPGPAPTYPRWLIGPPSGVIDVREEMWRFFRRFTRPEATTLARVAGATATASPP